MLFRSLETDPRATLLVEQWNRTDWSQLWWVRVGLTYVPAPAAEVTLQLANALEEKYAQYAGQPFERVLVFRVGEVTGWSAE